MGAVFLIRGVQVVIPARLEYANTSAHRDCQTRLGRS